MQCCACARVVHGYAPAEASHECSRLCSCMCMVVLSADAPSAHACWCWVHAHVRSCPHAPCVCVCVCVCVHVLRAHCSSCPSPFVKIARAPGTSFARFVRRHKYFTLAARYLPGNTRPVRFLGAAVVDTNRQVEHNARTTKAGVPAPSQSASTAARNCALFGLLLHPCASFHTSSTRPTARSKSHRSPSRSPPLL